ncbi:leucine-rich repeat domain-containing protein [Bacteroidales bacterium OttesenSCG-928-M06]|nr:leucine-rich repeat domain-containing protein [Bacteroidales bacterium OttesenSCG-928-M06]
MKRRLFIVLMCLAYVVQAWAQDFEVGGIYYKNIETNIVEVTSGDNRYEGDIVIPSSINVFEEEFYVVGIDNLAFNNNSSITSVTIPHTVYNIGNFAFEGCSSLTAIHVDADNEEYSSIDGVLFNRAQTKIYVYPKQKQSTTYTIPATVIEIEANTFLGSKLTEVIIPSGLISIGDFAFAGSLSLSSVVLPASVKKIGGAAFYSCISLKEVTIPSGVEEIIMTAFANCTSLTLFHADDNNLNYSSEDGILFNKDKTRLVCFPGGKAGEYIVPDKVTDIEIAAFHGCKLLRSVKLPSLITSLKEYCFFECSLLEEIVIPKSVTAISRGAFQGCSSLKMVQVNWNTPLEIDPDLGVFNNISLEECTLYVPVGTKALYESADVWKDFGTIIEGDMPTSINTPESESKIYIAGNTLYINTPLAETISVYSIKGELLYTFAKSAGEASFSLNKDQEQMLIVKSSSGETTKFVR